VELETKFDQRNYSWYDLADVTYKAYNRRNCTTNTQITVARGGIRARIFGTSSILLTKHPLICGFADILLPDSHFVERACIADFTGILLHYKFSGRFIRRICRAVQEENYYNSSSEYKAYLTAIRADPNRPFRTPTSEPWSDAQPMIESGFVTLSDDYLKWVSRYSVQ
ncbi:MAG: hypothetical protein KGJ37_03095, partial [Verrucomicrobiota bacterium]|nr:hypothetical protein [Verrucomicrobiota bacterium]